MAQDIVFRPSKALAAGAWSLGILIVSSAPLAQPQASPVPQSRGYLLVSAFGDRLSFVVRRKSIGSHIEPFVRRTLATRNHDLNMLVLRGLNEALAVREPGSTRKFLSVNPEELSRASADQREQAALDAALAAVRTFPARTELDEVIIVTPAQSLSQEDGMAPRLHGAGVFAQPVLSDEMRIFGIRDAGSRDQGDDLLGQKSPGGSSGGYAVVTPDGEAHQSWQYMSVYFHARIYRYDAVTLELISRVGRFDVIKYNDPGAGDLNHLKRIPARVVTEKLTALVVESSKQAVADALGVVTPGPLKVVPIK